MSCDFYKQDIVECSIYVVNSVSAIWLSKRALKDCECTYWIFYYFFIFHLIVKLFTLPAVFGLVNKELQYLYLYLNKSLFTNNVGSTSAQHNKIRTRQLAELFIEAGQLMSVCVSVSVCLSVGLGVNQGNTNRNRCTQRLAPAKEPWPYNKNRSPLPTFRILDHHRQ